MKLAKAEKMSLQELIDFSIKKIVEQGGQCKFFEGMCMYGNESRHCAIGWLLDEENNCLMEFEGPIGDVVDTYPQEIPSKIKENFDLFYNLQVFHDIDYKKDRMDTYKDMSKKFKEKINFNSPYFQKWIEMGRE